jgi:ATP/ADP translocase
MLQWRKLGMVTKSVGKAFIVDVGMTEFRFFGIGLLLIIVICFIIRWLRHLRDGLWFGRSSVQHDELGRVVERSLCL